MEKEKTRGRTRRKQPSQVAGFLYREGRKWCAAALSLCMILNNMASVTWAAESAAEKEVLFKLTSRSLYEALQEAVRKETMVDDHFLFEGKEKDVEAYEKLLLLDDDLYELKPEFENKDEVTEAEKKNDLQLRIFASLGWETDPEREYQVVGDEKIIFCLSNASETEQTAVIQVDEKTTEEIVLVPGSAVVVDSKSEESLEAESGDERKEDGKADEIESGESEGQAEEENNSEGIKEVGGNSSAGGASGGNGGNSGNGSNGGNSNNSSDSSNSSEREDIVESGSSAEGEDFAESEGSVESETSAKNEGSAGNESSVGTENSAENEGKADESAADAEENRNDETQEKADAEGQDKESKDSQETVNKPESGNSQEITKESGNTNAQENTNTQDKVEEKDERKDEEVKNNPASEKEETEKPDKTEAGSNESGKLDKAESGNNESEKTGKEESGNTDSGKVDKADKPDKTDKSDNKESSKPETSEKNKSSESGNTSTGKGEKSDTEKSGSERSGNSDSSKKSESTKKSSDSGSSDNSSDNGREVSTGISRNVIRLVADNLEVSASDDVEKTESAEETTIIDTQEEQKEETIEEESEEIKIETEEVTTKTEKVKVETASPSDVEDDEIEGELYAPVVMNEESIIVFVTTAEELGLNRAELRKASDSNAKRISPAYEDEIELENVIVQVKADENVLPEGVKLQVKELKEEGEDAAQYEEAKEALDSQGTEYDGMMALDISFLDKKGREIEPDGNVQVSIKVKKEALPEEADLESIAVQHLAEDEGEIFVEEVADCGNKTRGNVDIGAEEHIEAAFEVESFSRFIITWGSDGDVVAILNVSWVDEKGQPLSNENSDETIVVTKTEKFSLYDRFGKNFEGYDYVKAVVNAKQQQLGEDNIPTWEEIDKTIENAKEIEIKKLNVSWGPSYRVNVYHQIEDDTELTNTSFPSFAGLEVSVTLYYKKAEDLAAQLKITDEIETSGLLTVGPLDGETEVEGAKYAWYKQVNGIWERIERKKISGDLYNIPEETGKSINVALDDGARCYYKAELLDAQGKETGIKSEAFLVEYYDALQDGSFEDVKIPLSWSENGTGEGGKWAQLTDSTEGFKWKSTTGKIELVNGESYLHQPGADELLGYPKGAYDGKQFAELNPQTDGALYQDVLTVPGAKLNWELYHKARDPRSVPGIEVKDGTVTGKSADTMYLLIMPKQLAEGITSQAQVLEVIHNYQNYPGAYMVECTTALEEGWKRYGSSYVVGDNQYVTRFFFVAGPTISGSSSVGNFLDKVWFSSQLPPPAEG